MNYSDSVIISAHEASRLSENVARKRINGFIERKTLKGKTCLVVKVSNVRKIEEYKTAGGKTRLRLCISETDLEDLASLRYKITAHKGDEKILTNLYYVDWTHPPGITSS